MSSVLLSRVHNVTMVTGVQLFIQCQWESLGHVPIYKRGHYYGPLNNEKYTSVEHCVATFSQEQGLFFTKAQYQLH